MLSGMPFPDEGEIGSDGVRISRARCLEACLGVIAGVIAEAKRCYFCESWHETTNSLERTKTSNERKFIIDLGVILERWGC